MASVTLVSLVVQSACPNVPRSLDLTFDLDEKSKGNYIIISDSGSEVLLDSPPEEGLGDLSASSSSEDLRLYAERMLYMVKVLKTDVPKG